jgi:hypothetical protein
VLPRTAILEVRSIVPDWIVLIFKPFDTVLKLFATATSIEDLIYLIFVVFVSSAAIALPLMLARARRADS